MRQTDTMNRIAPMMTITMLTALIARKKRAKYKTIFIYRYLLSKLYKI